ncbi:MAG: acyl-CoA/acyl-ACP dehydrogenase [Chloroflexi bacterium]|nr:acyl-CoA/acyl-ACP dehydrogenase [Chloroflexota bacterium]
MDFSLGEGQTMLRTTARDFLTSECPKKLVREMEQDEKGYPPALWQKMAEMGWLGLVVPEAYGGMGLGYLDLAVLLQEAGRFCLPAPFFSSVVLGGLTIMAAGSASQKQELLPKLAEGKAILTLSLSEPEGYYTAGVRTTATPATDGWSLSGTKLFVTDAHIADYIICPAQTPEGLGLFLVDRNAPGVTCSLLKTISGDKQCSVVLDKVQVSSAGALGEPGKGKNYLDKVMPAVLMAKCAEMLGGAEQVLEMSLTYARERVQFGRPIGSFQAVQHHCANMAIALEGLRYITYKVAWLLDEGLPCATEAAIAKAYASDAYQQIAWLGASVHASIGFTVDHDLPLYYRRAKAAEVAFGDAFYHQELVAQAAGF